MSRPSLGTTMLGIGIDTLVTFNPITVTPHTPIDEVVRLMSQHGIHHLPVIDGDLALVGMVSDLDVSRVLDQLPELIGDAAQDPALIVDAMPFVAEVVTQTVQYIAPGDPPEAALALIVQNEFHCVPVVHLGRLEGIITSTDFLREMSYGESPLARQSVARVMRPLPTRIEASVEIVAASRVMQPAGNYLLVESAGHPRGVLSQRQLRRARLGELLADAPWLDHSSAWNTTARCVGDLLPVDLLTVTPNEPLSVAAQRMLERRVQGLLVIDSTRRLSGIVTECDLLAALLG
ncbi:MAG: CBS domain-containing protein [Planctomycetaceae bacterium]|nr:CBS domain-containing protein [Planctomycetaceae bacterium]